MKKARPDAAPLSRRRFVAMLAAGSAALIAPGGVAAAAAAAAPRARAAAAGSGAAALSAVDRRELVRQQAATRATLEVIRGHAMPAGTEMASIFRVLPQRRRNG